MALARSPQSPIRDDTGHGGHEPSGGLVGATAHPFPTGGAVLRIE